MIAKGSSTIVNFYVADTDGLPATGQASNIAASISIDGGSATTISATISEKDSNNLPGWYEFEYTFNTEGNAFITFSCSGCIIMPWEEQVVDLDYLIAPSASEVAEEVWTTTLSGVTTTVNSTYQKMIGISANVWAVPVRSLTSLNVTYQGTTNELATASDIGYIYNVMAKSTELSGLAKSADIEKILSGLLHWTVSANTLTLYDSSNNSLGTYTLTRDSSGNITGVTPN